MIIDSRGKMADGQIQKIVAVKCIISIIAFAHLFRITHIGGILNPSTWA
jgi:hypothetical protein